MSKLAESRPPQPVGGDLALPGNAVAASPWFRLGALLLERLIFTVTLGIGWMIWALVTVQRGQTPAKSLLNQRVVDARSLEPVGFVRMFWVRGLLAGLVAGLAIVLTLGVLAFMPFWDRHNRNLWDRLSQTYVLFGCDDA